MSKKKKKKDTDGNITIDINFALSRAASLLIYAGESAIESGNTKHMIEVASAWAQFSGTLDDGEQQEDQEDEHLAAQGASFGFSHMELAEKFDEYEDEECEEDE